MLFRSLLLLFLVLMSVVSAEMTPKEALKQLIEGNKRYRHEKLIHPNHNEDARLAVKSQQNPFATIVGCSDSRVPPEIVFDQGVGDLFIVRVAGNVVGDVELDSVDYSAKYLKSSLILVLGHQNCGAIKAVIDGNTQDIKAVAALIEPSLKLAKTQNGSLLENTVKDNVIHVVEQLKKTPLLADLIKKGAIDVVGCYYDFQSGGIELLTKSALPSK